MIPVNGYINRLQAWASAQSVAAALGAEFSCLWIPEPVAPAPLELLFDTPPPRGAFADMATVGTEWAVDPADVPRYLHANPEKGVITLAGHDQGEQVFMAQLEALMNDPRAPRSLVIKAGGAFHLPSASNPTQDRVDFYRSLPWAASVRAGLASNQRDRGSYLGLHIRGTDRARSAPTERAIVRAVLDLANRTAMTSVFIAADTQASRDVWTAWAQDQGLSSWTSGVSELDRSQAKAGIGALVDWHILADAHSMVFARESSFGAEAAIQNVDPHLSIALGATAPRRLARDVGALSRNVVRRVRSGF